MTRRQVDPKRWVRVGPGAFRTLDGRGGVTKVGPHDWAGWVGPPGLNSRRVGNGTTAHEASRFVERVLDEK